MCIRDRVSTQSTGREGLTMVVLTLAMLSDVTKGDPKNTTRLSLKGRDLTVLEGIGACAALKTLDLSQNSIVDLSQLSDNKELRSLNVTNNALEVVDELESLSNLEVLNLGNNEIRLVSGIGKLKELKALILNNNKMVKLKNIGGCKLLNTLVVSHNHLTELECVRHLTNLRKISASNNQIRSLDPLVGLHALTELRLTNNKIVTLPASLSRNAQLKIVDLGGNLLQRLTDIEPLWQLPDLKTLNLAGNPLAESDVYSVELIKLMPQLKQLDGKLTAEAKALKTEKQMRKEQKEKIRSGEIVEEQQAVPNKRPGGQGLSVQRTKIKFAEVDSDDEPEPAPVVKKAVVKRVAKPAKEEVKVEEAPAPAVKVKRKKRKKSQAPEAQAEPGPTESSPEAKKQKSVEDAQPVVVEEVKRKVAPKKAATVRPESGVVNVKFAKKAAQEFSLEDLDGSTIGSGGASGW
eukprot:TRINITY_DN7179_c0_g1_i1.p1 TRINITY_DN7179_c0_g1~~TRINITY_DN7179_c0_g1_i1.p1  ORF type:complete len:462 (-),score=143.68 TRINITY_DN7179_c0_g1_i1:189-1574(-)